MAAGRVLLRVRAHSGPCLDLLQSGIVRTSARPLKGPAAVARPPGCVVAIPFSRHSASGRKTAYLRSVRAAKDMDRGIDSCDAPPLGRPMARHRESARARARACGAPLPVSTAAGIQPFGPALLAARSFRQNSTLRQPTSWEAPGVTRCSTAQRLHVLLSLIPSSSPSSRLLLDE